MADERLAETNGRFRVEMGRDYDPKIDDVDDDDDDEQMDQEEVVKEDADLQALVPVFRNMTQLTLGLQNQVQTVIEAAVDLREKVRRDGPASRERLGEFFDQYMVMKKPKSKMLLEAACE